MNAPYYDSEDGSMSTDVVSMTSVETLHSMLSVQDMYGIDLTDFQRLFDRVAREVRAVCLHPSCLDHEEWQSV